jgi:hypothetical protein
MCEDDDYAEDEVPFYMRAGNEVEEVSDFGFWEFGYDGGDL